MENLEFKWIKGPTSEQVRARLEPKLKGMTLEEKFSLAVKNDVIWLFQECIDAGYDPSVWNNWAIRYTSSHGRLEVVKVLLADTRVDPSVYDNLAIEWSYYGHPEVVKALLANKRVRDKLSPKLKIKFKELL